MSLIKNAFLYYATLPDRETMSEALAKRPFRPIGEAEYQRSSFVVNDITKELVTPIDGGYSFVFRRDKKTLKGAAINSVLAERVREIEEREDRKLGRQERRDLKGQIEMELLRVTPAETTFVNALYHVDREILILATGSGGIADNIMEDLNKVFEEDGVDARLITIDDLAGRLTTRLLDHVNSEEPVGFGGFELGNYVQMKNDSKEKATFESIDRDPADGIQEAASNACRVERIELHSQALTFRLTKEFYFKSIKFGDIDMDDIDENDDGAGYWRHEASVQMQLVSKAAENLVETFDGTKAA